MRNLTTTYQRITGANLLTPNFFYLLSFLLTNLLSKWLTMSEEKTEEKERES